MNLSIHCAWTILHNAEHSAKINNIMSKNQWNITVTFVLTDKLKVIYHLYNTWGHESCAMPKQEWHTSEWVDEYYYLFTFITLCTHLKTKIFQQFYYCYLFLFCTARPIHIPTKDVHLQLRFLVLWHLY
jgi:hypothetical protein